MSVFYEFDKVKLKKHQNYIFQLVKDRKMTDIDHSHDFYECQYVVEGNAVQHLNGNNRKIEKGTAMILRPNDRHSFVKQSKDVAVLSLSVKKEEFEAFSNAYAPQLLACIQSGEDPKPFSFQRILSLDVFQKEDGNNVTEFDCKLLLSALLKEYIDETNCLQGSSKLPPMLAYAVEEMKKRENLKRGIAAFTQLSHYSQSHLSRLIKKYFDTSLKQYINELRLQSAYNDIVITRKSAEEISEELGFASFSHFNKIFKARFSITPAALRKSSGIWTA